MGETIAILFIFFLLLVFGMMFYIKVLGISLASQKEESIQIRAVDIAERASFLSELQCSEENIISEDCIDILKLDAANQIMQDNNEDYYDMLGFSDITVKEIYPSSNSWGLYNRVPASWKDKIPTHIPILLYNATEQKYAFGILTVAVYT